MTPRRLSSHTSAGRKASRFKLSSMTLALAFFLTLNAPTVKNFIPSNTVNILPLLIILGMLAFKSIKPVRLHGARALFVTTLILFFGSLLATGLFHSMESFTFLDLFKYVNILVTLIMVALVAEQLSIVYFVRITVLWGVFLAFSVKTEYVDVSNLNYLQLGHPIALGLIVSTVFIFSQRSIMKKVALVIIGVFLLSALMSMYGRSPLLFPLAVLGFIGTAKLLFRHRLGLLLFLPTSVAVYAFSAPITYNLLPEHIRDRLTRLMNNPTNEPRFELWVEALAFISESPLFGHGLEAAWHLLGYTPHNFFLEVALTAGVLALFPYIVGLLLWVRKGMRILNATSDTTATALLGASLYYFLRFQIGGAIGSSYDFFILMLLVIVFEIRRVRRS